MKNTIFFVTVFMSSFFSCKKKDQGSNLATIDLFDFNAGEYNDYTKAELDIAKSDDHNSIVKSFTIKRNEYADKKIEVPEGKYYFKLRFLKDSETVLDSEKCTKQDKVHAVYAGILNSFSLSVCPSTGRGGDGVSITGRKLLVGGDSYFIKGVCWNPVPKGQADNRTIFLNPSQYANDIEKDIQLMKEAGINTVRPYTPIKDKGVLDQLYQAGIRVVVPFFGYQSEQDVINIVNEVKSHPAILLYEIGNEWNYNKLYTTNSLRLNEWQAADHIRKLSKAIKSADTSHPVSTSYGEIPSAETVNSFPNIDMWGVNVYSGITFGNRFELIKQRFNKPVYFSEFGADNFNTTNKYTHQGHYDPQSSATAIDALIGEIIDHNAFKEGGVVVGGTVFEWSDEWWKYDRGSAAVQDNHSSSPSGGGPHPDKAFNEEWWGIVDIDRNKRAGYEMLKKRYTSFTPPRTSNPSPTGPVESGETMTFMSWNVHFENTNYAGMAQTINAIKPDIFGLNEFTKDENALIGSLQQGGKQYKVQTLGTEFGYGTKIFYDSSRFREIKGGSESIYCTGTMGGNRAANYTLLEDMQSKQQFIAGGIHLSFCQWGCDETHRCELRKLYEKFNEIRGGKDTPIIWMGDINRGTHDTIYRDILSGTFTGNSFQTEDFSRSHRGTYFSTSGVIDYIFAEKGRWERISGGSTCQGTQGHHLANADHFPVYSRVKLNNGVSASSGNMTPSCPN